MRQDKYREMTQELLLERYEYRDGHLFYKCPSKFLRKELTNKEIGHIKKDDGYRITRISNKQYYVHRLIFLYHHGYVPTYVDHINNDRADNRIENLREVDSVLNCANRSHYTFDMTSKFKGVYQASSGKYVAYIYKNRKQIYLGRFDDELEAALHYNKAAISLFGVYAKLNHVVLGGKA